MKQLTVRKEIRLTPTQADSLQKLSQYGVNANYFIRQAIKEKIKRDWPEIKEQYTRIKIPF